MDPSAVQYPHAIGTWINTTNASQRKMLATVEQFLSRKSTFSLKSFQYTVLTQKAKQWHSWLAIEFTPKNQFLANDTVPFWSNQTMIVHRNFIQKNQVRVMPCNWVQLVEKFFNLLIIYLNCSNFQRFPGKIVGVEDLTDVRCGYRHTEISFEFEFGFF